MGVAIFALPLALVSIKSEEILKEGNLRSNCIQLKISVLKNLRISF